MKITRKPRLLSLSFCPTLIPLVLSGAKTNTMRVVKPQPFGRDGVLYWQPVGSPYTFPYFPHDGDALLRRHIAEAYKLQPGDQFFVNEPIEILDVGRGIVLVRYVLDGLERECTLPERVTVPSVGRWPGRNLPPEWARGFRGTAQSVTGMRVQEIDWQLAKAEGVSKYLYPACGDHPDMIGYVTPADGEFGAAHKTREEAFAKLWDTINTNPAHRFEANPWVSSLAWTPGDNT